MRRVLVRGGRALLSVWKSASPYNIAVGEVLGLFAGAEIARKYRELRAVPDAATLHRMLVEAGLQDAHIRSRAMVVRLPSIETFVIGQLSSSPVAGAIAEWSEERRSRFGRQVAEALRPYADGDGVAYLTRSTIATGCG